jgi:predicted neutral ceramidase superfamily lipid hydrolase
LLINILSAVRHFYSSVDSGVQWLDFFEQLLYVDAEGKPQLKSEFQHDGTHLHPGYVALVEHALNNAN